jgi:glycosyltransferase involved in cell wall biosynthesis
MRKILILIPDLNFNGHARQASLLAGALPADRFHVEVLGLGGGGPFAEPLRCAGIIVETRKCRRVFNVKNWFALRRRLLTDPPDIVHVFGMASLRELSFAMFGKFSATPPIVASISLTSRQGERASWFTARLLRRASAVVVANDPEREAMIARGFSPGMVHTIRPGVPFPGDTPERTRFCKSLAIPDEAKLILSVGQMNRLDRMHQVFWAFDILHYVDRSVHAVLFGDGRYRFQTETNARDSMFDDYRMHFLGAQTSAASSLPLAEMVWVVPGSHGGNYAVLEGMAAGKPVIASALPHLAAIIEDGETGLLVPPTNPPALAGISHKLLQDDALCRRLGESARAAVETRFRVDLMANRFAEVYDSLVGGKRRGSG